MALEVHTLRDTARPTAIIADRRLYLAADRTTVVEEGDRRAAFLLAGQGSEIPAAEVERLGLSLDDGRVTLDQARPMEPEGAKARRAGENKMRHKGADK